MEANTKIIGIWNDEAWRYPVIAGGVMIPVVVVLQYTDSGVSGIVPPFLAGLLVGFWAVETSISGTHLGWRAGLISGLSLVYGSMDFLLSTSQTWLNSSSVLLTIATLVTAPFVTVLFILIYGVAGAIGGTVGSWARNNENLVIKPA